MKKISILIAIMTVLCVVCAACASDQPKITLSAHTLEIQVGESTLLTAAVEPEGSVEWASSDIAVATVENGTVTARSVGACEITATSKGVKAVCKVNVKEKLPPTDDKIIGIANGEDVVYSFDVASSGLYDVTVAHGGALQDVRALESTVTFRFDNSYVTRLRSKYNIDNTLFIGTKYLMAGSHQLTVSGIRDILAGTEMQLNAAECYESVRMKGAEKWLNILYRETGYNTEEPNFVGYTEADNWQDLWTHCQYLPNTMFLADYTNNSLYRTRVKTIADELLIGKMLTESGGAYTIYRARDDVFQVSIEPDMPTDKFELWRGTAAFCEEMLNCYLYFGDESYLEYAKKSADYILSKWSKTTIDGIFGTFYTRYSGSPNSAIEIMSTGRTVMVLSQMYLATNDVKYKRAATAQAEALLKAQVNPYPEFDGLFASYIEKNGSLNEFRHGNAFANALLGMSWVYKITGDAKYLNSINSALMALDKVYDDELGMVIVMDGKMLPYNGSTGATYMAGRIGQAVMTAAAFTNTQENFCRAERVLEFAFGRNLDDYEMQNSLGGYYYQRGYTGESNIETSGEMYLAQIQYYYLKNIWKVF